MSVGVALAATLLSCSACSLLATQAEATSPTVNVRDYGARGDGANNDTRPLRRAMRAVAAQGGGTVYLPKGVYKVTPVTVPDGVRLVGDGMRLSWIRGGVTVGSEVLLRDLKVGARDHTFRTTAGAHDSTFVRCRFRGGGDHAYVVLLGDMDRSCSDITFQDCKIECNLGRANAAHSNPVNNIRITENAAPGGAHVEHVTFDGCHIGVSNGRRRGSPRACLEAYTWNSTGVVAHGWSDLRIVDCVFEAADEFTIDLADCNRVSDVHSGPALISGCTIKGGGKADGARWGYAICIERPNGVVIESNTIYRASNNTIGTAVGHLGTDDAGPVIRGNLFDFTFDNGIRPRAAYIYLRGPHVQFTDNRIVASRGTVFKIEDASDVTVTNNDVALGKATLWKLGANITRAVLEPNTVH